MQQDGNVKAPQSAKGDGLLAAGLDLAVGFLHGVLAASTGWSVI